jgi:amino acid transporter
VPAYCIEERKDIDFFLFCLAPLSNQVVYFRTKNPSKFWRALERKILAFLWSFGIFYVHLVLFMDMLPYGNVVTIWYIFLSFGILCKEKSGNPAVSDQVSVFTLYRRPSD